MNCIAVLGCCAVCETETGRRCSRCLDIFYCSREHQRNDWKRHKSECLPKLTEDPRKELQNTSKKVIDNKSETNKVRHKNSRRSASNVKKKSHVTEVVGNSNEAKEKVEVPSSASSSPVPEQGVDKIADLSILQDSIVKSNIVYNKDSSENAITYEGSSEKEILSESAQQLGTDFKPQSPANVFSSRTENSDKESVNMTGVVAEAPVRMPREYPEATLRGNQLQNYAVEVNDPLYPICQQVIRDMTQYGVCVLNNFFGKERGMLVLEEVLGMYKKGIFTAGQLVSNTASTESQTIRSDLITWISGMEKHCTHIAQLINQVDNIIIKANRMLNNGKMGDFVINGRTKAMVACYPGCGTHYVKHVDNPNRDGRCITAIYYLNRDWSVDKNGGLLRVFPEGTDTVANIEPIFDRMLFFWSDRRNPHEVQPAFATRYAITLWYFDSQEREEALRRFKSRAVKASTSK